GALAQTVNNAPQNSAPGVSDQVKQAPRTGDSAQVGGTPSANVKGAQSQAQDRGSARTAQTPRSTTTPSRGVGTGDSKGRPRAVLFVSGHGPASSERKFSTHRARCRSRCPGTRVATIRCNRAGRNRCRGGQDEDRSFPMRSKLLISTAAACL